MLTKGVDLELEEVGRCFIDISILFVRHNESKEVGVENVHMNT